MRTPMQMKYATKVAHRRRASRENNLPYSILLLETAKTVSSSIVY